MDQRKKLASLLAQAEHMHTARDGFARWKEMADHVLENGFVDLSHLMLLEVDEDYGSFQVPKVILYNENHVTQEESLRIARAGEYHPSVLVLPKRQWESLFLNRKEG